jgi:uncharacterized surface protein with fasciclin (FAS1) repeats
MKKLIILLMVPIIGFSQSNCENSILDEVLQNTEVNQYFQLALSLNMSELEFINNCDQDINYTMFVPGNNVPNESAALLLGLTGELIEYIPYYIYMGDLSYAELIELNGNSIEMMDGNQAIINYDDGSCINEALITIEDICACNGTIHIIDDLIWAPGVINLYEKTNSIELHINSSENTLNLSKITKEGEVKILDTSGKVVFSKNVNNHVNINTSKYKAGIYIINFQSAQQQLTKLISIN